MKYLLELSIFSCMMLTLGSHTFAQYDPSEFEITEKPSVWENTKVKDWAEYSYQSIELVALNADLLKNYRFSESEVKDQRRKYLNICLTIPKSENGSWLDDDVIFPLYFWELARGDNMQFTNTEARIINSIPLRNSKSDYIKMKLDIEAIQEKELDQVLDRTLNSVAVLAGTPNSNALALSRNFIQEYSQAALAFKRKIRSSTIRKYAWDYTLNTYPFDQENSGKSIIKKVEVYTLKSRGSNELLPLLDAKVREFKSINDLRQHLTKQSKLFPQFLVIYRVAPFDYEKFFLTDFSDEEIKQQKKLVYELIDNQSLTPEEEEILIHLLKMKEYLQSMMEDRDAYYLKNGTTGNELVSLMEDYYAFKNENNKMIIKYRSKPVFNTLKSLLTKLDSKASELLTENVGKSNLKDCKTFFDQFFAYNDALTNSNQTSKMEKAHRDLKYFDNHVASLKNPNNNGIYHPSFEGELKSMVANLEQRLYILKYKKDCEILKKENLGDDGDNIKAKLKSSQQNEICEFCVTEIDKAIKTYDGRIVADQLHKANQEYNNHHLASLNLLRKYDEVNAKIENRLNDKVIRVETILDLSKAEFKKLKEETETYIDLIKKVPIAHPLRS